MRYLKKFNEDLERDVDGDFTAATLDEIKDYCELNLAYLLDVGMRIECSDVVDDSTGIHECQVELLYLNDIKYSSILDQVIPFLKRIKNDYQLGTLGLSNHTNFLFNSSEGKFSISEDELDDIENDLISSASTQRNIQNGFDIKIYNILFYIKDEK
jgi:hypothetical protein